MAVRIKTTILLILFLSTAVSGLAQFEFVPYYGKNKVIYAPFPWKNYPTEHFKIFYYADNGKTLKDVAQLAESAYQRISHILKHQLATPVPLLYYSTYTDFEQTNLFDISEGVLGVSEPILHRIGIHGDMPLDGLQSLIEHELTHVFEFDLLWGNQGGRLYSLNQPPLWTFEGLSEYATGAWSPWSSLIVRDAVLNDRIPEFSDSGELFSSYPLPREPAYDFGHALYEFIESKYGASGLRQFWGSLKGAMKIGKRDIFQRAFNLKTKEFLFEFKKYLRLKNSDFLLRENPENYSITLGPEFPINPYYFAFSHVLSPSGDIVATLTFNVKDMDLDIVLISTKDGSVIRNITPGYTLQYENIKFEVDPAEGKNLAWSQDGDSIVFFGRDGRRHSLFVIDALSGRIRKKIKLPVDQPASPSFFPSGTEVLFAAFEKGRHDIFKVNLNDASVTRLTDDDAYEKAPEVSPDGKTLAFTIRKDGTDKIFLSPADDLSQKTQLTFGKGNTVSPHFSPDGKEIFFSGDERGAYNLYSIHVDTGEMKRYTDVRTGSFFPAPLPSSPNTIVFSSFNKGAVQIFKSALESKLETAVAVKETSGDSARFGFEPAVKLDIDRSKIQAYQGMGKLYISAAPPVNVIFSTDGSLFGGSALSFSDMLGDHTFTVTSYQVRSFRSSDFSYINQKKRFQYMASAFQYYRFYYPNAYYFDLDAPYSSFSYQDAMAARKISGIRLAGFYPFNRYYRAEVGIGYSKYEEYVLSLYSFSRRVQAAENYFWNGSWFQVSASLIGETTFFKEFGPYAGSTLRLTATQSLPLFKNFFSNSGLEIDARRYFCLGADSLFAFRFEGFFSIGRNPYFRYFGGNNQIRSAYYNSLVANQGWYANAELRFPLISTASTILGRVGPLRGAFFVDLGRAKIKGSPAKIIRYKNGNQEELAEYDAIGSFGYGFEFFLFGLPLHIEFVKGIGIPDISRPFTFDKNKKFDLNFWIGFDF